MVATGCEDDRLPAAGELHPSGPDANSSFDASTCGTIRGQVVWDGPTPVIPPFEIPAYPMAGEAFARKQTRPNPHAPQLHVRSAGIGNAVVLLRGVDPQRAKPWSHSPVVVEQRAAQFHLFQDGQDATVAFVRPSGQVAMVSRDRLFYGLHAGGAAYFTLMFPEPNQPLERTLTRPGVVELASAAGCYWMRAYLFVEDQPYCTRTDTEGRFELSGVPAGHYEVVCWLPSWMKARHERDPESGLIARWYFQRPCEQRQSIKLGPQETRDVPFRFAASMFSSLPGR
jgi:hypothetical protein